jgi:hypothetical protein
MSLNPKQEEKQDLTLSATAMAAAVSPTASHEVGHDKDASLGLSNRVFDGNTGSKNASKHGPMDIPHEAAAAGMGWGFKGSSGAGMGDELTDEGHKGLEVVSWPQRESAGSSPKEGREMMPPEDPAYPLGDIDDDAVEVVRIFEHLRRWPCVSTLFIREFCAPQARVSRRVGMLHAQIAIDVAFGVTVWRWAPLSATK